MLIVEECTRAFLKAVMMLHPMTQSQAYAEDDELLVKWKPLGASSARQHQRDEPEAEVSPASLAQTT